MSSRHPVLRFISLATLVFLAGEARGYGYEDLPRDNPWPAEPAPATRWYGYQIVLVDTFGFLLGSSTGPVGTVFVPMLIMTPAGIHIVHHNPRMAILSPLLRLGLVGGLMATGYYTADCDYLGKDGCGTKEAWDLGLVGLLAATIVDAFTAFEPMSAGPAPPVRPAANRSPVSFASAGVAPNAQGGLSLVLGGRF
jgi:hypothetical protein